APASSPAPSPEDADKSEPRRERKAAPKKDAEVRGKDNDDGGRKGSLRKKEKDKGTGKKVRGARSEEFVLDDDGGGFGGRRRGGRRKAGQGMEHKFEKPTEFIAREIGVPEAITVANLAQKMSVKSSAVIKTLMSMGVM